MGIEAIGAAVGSISKGASVAPALGRGVTIGGIPAPRMEGFSVTRIANPFRVEPVAPKPSFRVAGVVTEVERIVKNNGSISLRHSREGGNPINNNIYGSRIKSGMTKGTTANIVRTPEPAVVWLPSPTRELDVRVIKNPFSLPKVEAKPQSIVQKRAESRASGKTAGFVSRPALKEQTVEQVVEEKKYVLEDQKKDEPKAKKSEKTSLIKVKLVEAVEISERRRAKIKAAVKNAKAEVEQEGLKGISGKLVRKLLMPAFWEDKSPIVGEGRDGTITPTAWEIETNTTEYSSETEAENAFVQAVANHIPLKEGKEGRIATWEEVREVLEGKEKGVFRTQTLAEIVVKRVVKKNEVVASTGQAVKTAVEEKEESNSENSLKDFPILAAVFQKRSN